ncbi:MAG TPA: DUF551 domain-containing protein [Polyangiaceae bacterium]|nr:DUF551 domain-containing protein [Polyangiaceae bacterium]
MTNPTTPTQVELDELEATVKAGTPGPWHREMIELGPGGPMTLGVGAQTAPICIVNGIVESPLGNRNVAAIVAMRNSIEALIAEVRAHRWIPCSERMPEPLVRVLVAVDSETHIGCWESSAWWSPTAGDYDGRVPVGEVTHWMPLPAPPAVKEPTP